MAESTAPATITPKDLADKLSTDSKTVRRFLRRQHGDDAPGQGGRWSIPAADVKKLAKEFEAWQKSEAERKAARDAEKGKAETDEAKSEPKAKSPKTETKVTKTAETVAAAKQRLAEAHEQGRHPSGKVPSCPTCEANKTDAA
jgi:hypothetical protein